MRRVGDLLRARLTPLILAAVDGGPGTPLPGPRALSLALGLDMATASRVLRALRSADAAALVHGLPSPRGLSLVVDAAGRHGVDDRLCSAAAEAVGELARLIGLFPGGRKALLSAIAGWVPSIRQRGEQDIKQASYQAYAHLLGIEIEANIRSDVIFPSATTGHADVANIVHYVNLSRLRNSHPISVYSTSLVTSASAYETLEGDRITRPEDVLLKDFCTEPVSALDVVNEDDQRLWVVIDGSTPAVNARMSVAGALVGRAAMPMDSESGTISTMVNRFPSRLLVWDTFIHEEIFSGIDPMLTPRYFGMTVPWKHPTHPHFGVDQVDMAVSLQRLGFGLQRIGLSEREGNIDLSDNVELLRAVFDRLGADPDRFVAYRHVAHHPMPWVSLERLIRWRSASSGG